MITTPLSFHEKAKGQVIDLVSKLYISFDKERYKPTFPDDFQEIEYIQSTGTQYIDSGVKGNINTEVEYSVNKITPSTQNTISVFGDNSVSSSALSLNVETINSSGRNSRFGNKVASVTNISTNTLHTMSINKNNVIIDNNIVGTFNTTDDFTTVGNLLYGKIGGNSFGSKYFDGDTKLYECRIYNNIGEVRSTIRSFVPAKAKRDSKNLLNRPIGTTYTGQGLSFKHNADNIIVNGTATETWGDCYSKITTSLPAGTYTFSIKNALPKNITIKYYHGGTTSGSTILAGNTSATFTSNEEITGAYLFIATNSGTVYNNYEILEPMLVAGDTTQNYEPQFTTGTAGLYDIANDKFYTNSGTGTFTAGQPVEHTGTVDYFTLDKSVLNGIDRLDSSENNPIQLWDTYSYYDFSDRIISASIERSIEFPYGTQCAMADVTLNNFDRYFDPANSISPIAKDNLPNRPIKLYAGYRGETVVPQFVGLTQQMPIMNGNGTVSYHAVDFLSEIASQTLNSTIAMRDARTDQVLAKIVEQFGVTPLQYNFEAGTNVIPFVFFDKGENAGDVIQRLIQAEGGKFWLDETGILRFERRSSSGSEAVVSISEYDIISVEPSGISDIINRVKISCELREVQEYQTVYSKNSTGDAIDNLWVVGAGQSIVRECRLEDPCYDVVSPTLGKNSAVSYFTAKNSEQQEVSSGITAVGELSTNAYTITFTNSNLFPVEIDEVQLWGEPAKVYDVLDYDAYEDESVEKYGEQVLEITDNKFFQSFNQAQAFAVYLLNDRAKYNSTIKLQVKGDFSLQLGDAFELQGDYAGSYRIDAITWSLSNDSFVYTIKAHKFEPIDYFILDQSILDGDDVLA